MDNGENYYDAFRDALAIEGTPPSEVALPAAASIPRLAPSAVRRPLHAYLVLVVGATAWRCCYAARHQRSCPSRCSCSSRAYRVADGRGVVARGAWTVPLVAGSLPGSTAMVVGRRWPRWPVHRELTFPVL